MGYTGLGCTKSRRIHVAVDHADERAIGIAPVPFLKRHPLAVASWSTQLHGGDLAI